MNTVVCNVCRSTWESYIDFHSREEYTDVELFVPRTDCPQCGPRRPIGWIVAQVGIEEWHFLPKAT